MKAVARLILTKRKEPGLYSLLNVLLGLELGGLQPLPRIFERLNCMRLLQLLTTPDMGGILSDLVQYMGVGGGLTLAGDDLILGLLLAYQRWGAVLNPVFDLAKLGEGLNQAETCSTHKTTLLSANRIACASQGQADERLIHALDGIMTGNVTPHQCARDLSGWGNSSGCDALLGMTLAILSAG